MDSRLIINNNTLDRRLKYEYISMINRLHYNQTIIKQLYRSMNYHILYNTLYDDILYLIKQKKYFESVLKGDTKKKLSKFIDDNIQTYNYHIQKLN